MSLQKNNSTYANRSSSMFLRDFFSNQICNFSSILTSESSFLYLQNMSQIHRVIFFTLIFNKKT